MKDSVTPLVDSLKGKEKIRILFVCLGNICRSPAAEEITRSLAVEKGLADRLELDSAGLYGGHQGEMPDSRMRAHAYRRGLRLTHRSRPVKESDLSEFDIVVAMDDSNFSRLRHLAPTPEDEAKIVRMTDFSMAIPYYDHIPDPYYEGAEGFELVLDLLQDSCGGLLKSLFDD